MQCCLITQLYFSPLSDSSEHFLKVFKSSGKFKLRKMGKKDPEHNSFNKKKSKSVLSNPNHLVKMNV